MACLLLPRNRSVILSEAQRSRRICGCFSPLLRFIERGIELQEWKSGQNTRAARFEKRARIFDGPVLIAAEEARSRAGGQHAQVPPRANAPLTRPRPAPCSRCKQSLNGKNVHGEPRWLEHSPTSASVYSRTAPAARAIAFESCSRPKSLRQPQKLDGRRPCNSA